jgi:hypothetical protein
LPNSPWPGIIYSDIPAGDGKIDNLFYSVLALAWCIIHEDFQSVFTLFSQLKMREKEGGGIYCKKLTRHGEKCRKG